MKPLQWFQADEPRKGLIAFRGHNIRARLWHKDDRFHWDVMVSVTGGTWKRESGGDESERRRAMARANGAVRDVLNARRAA